MSVVKLKVTATAIIEIETNDAVDYDGIEEFIVSEDDPVTQEDVAIAMVKYDDEEDSLPMDEWEWSIKEIEVMK
jgi:hypothetical protein